jgi:hypothetical protein
MLQTDVASVGMGGLIIMMLLCGHVQGTWFMAALVLATAAILFVSAFMDS